MRRYLAIAGLIGRIGCGASDGGEAAVEEGDARVDAGTNESRDLASAGADAADAKSAANDALAETGDHDTGTTATDATSEAHGTTDQRADGDGADAGTASTIRTDAAVDQSPHGGNGGDPIVVLQGDHCHVVGDSLTAYQWYLPLEAQVATAKDDTGAAMAVTWSAAGVAGYDVKTVFNNRQSMIFDHDADFMIIALGRNNTGTAAEQLAADVDQLLAAILTWKPSIRLAWIGAMWAGEVWTQSGDGPPMWNNPGADAVMEATNATIAAECAKYHVPYIDGRGYSLLQEPYYKPNKVAYGTGVGGPPQCLTFDGTHPNYGSGNGSVVMSQAVLARLGFRSALN